MNYYISVLKQYAEFSGRTARKEYWMFVLINFVISVVIGVVGNAINMEMLSTLYSLAVMIPGLAVSIRRLHDINKSGWMLLVSLIPIVGLIWLIVLMATKGDEGENQYGPAPVALE